MLSRTASAPIGPREKSHGSQVQRKNSPRSNSGENACHLNENHNAKKMSRNRELRDSQHLSQGNGIYTWKEHVYDDARIGSDYHILLSLLLWQRSIQGPNTTLSQPAILFFTSIKMHWWMYSAVPRWQWSQSASYGKFAKDSLSLNWVPWSLDKHIIFILHLVTVSTFHSWVRHRQYSLVLPRMYLSWLLGWKRIPLSQTICGHIYGRMKIFSNPAPWTSGAVFHEIYPSIEGATAVHPSARHKPLSP